VRGSGFYALQYPQSATAPAPSDPRPALTGLPTPTLIVKGGCDYLSWRSAIDYRTRLPRSQLLYLPEAGHNVHQEQPAVFREAVRAFLDDRPVPGRVPPGADDVPAGYRGPR
jgi:proline iminopeptidase